MPSGDATRTPFTCTVAVGSSPNNSEIEEARTMAVLLGAGLLVGAEGQLYLSHVADSDVMLEPIPTPPMGRIHKMVAAKNIGVLIGAEYGLFIARFLSGRVDIERATGATTPNVRDIVEFPDAGFLVRTDKELFRAFLLHDQLTIRPIGNSVIGPAYEMADLGTMGFLITTSRESFLARAGGEGINLAPVGLPAGSVYRRADLPGVGLFMDTEHGFLLLRSRDVRLVRLRSVETRDIRAMRTLPGAGVLIGGNDGLFLVREANGTIRVDPVAAQPPTAKLTVVAMGDLPGVGVLVLDSVGVLVARAVEGNVHLQRLGSKNGEFSIENSRDGPHDAWGHEMHTLPNAGVLIGVQGGLFLARAADAGVTLERVKGPTIHRVFHLEDFAGAGVLVNSASGTFVVLQDSSGLVLSPLANLRYPGLIEHWETLDGFGVLLSGSGHILFASTTPLSSAAVEPEKLEGIAPGNTFDVPLDFTIKHPCAPVLQELGLGVRLLSNGSQPVPPPALIRIVDFHPYHGEAHVTVRLPIHTAASWELQFVSVQSGKEVYVGRAPHLQFTAPPALRIDSERWDSLLRWFLPALLVASNVALFVAARRSRWAWEIATSNKFRSSGIRLVTFALSYMPKAQIWILDLYFQNRRKSVEKPAPFLPIPLTCRDGRRELSTRVVKFPWKSRRVWVQGNSGMGKTALLRYVAAMHFRSNMTAFEAFRRCGCILVAFSARDFAGGGEDKHDPEWVINSIRSTLSQRGMTFDDVSLLQRMLRTGVMAIAIDGLHEAGRSNAIDAFARAYEASAILVTSQESGSDLFESWKLPFDIRAFVDELLQLQLNAVDAQTVIERIRVSGLKDAIQSGYDVRLIADLARADPQNAALPSDRISLYERVVSMGWPEAPAELIEEQQSRTFAAAWHIVSERKPHEDKRRLIPNVDLALDLLNALTDAPERDGRPVRLVRRVGAAFEFVHDQMHAFMAARWFSQSGLSTSDLAKMVSTSTIWSDAPSARRTLWGFAVALLDDRRLVHLLNLVEDEEDWDILRRELKKEVERRKLSSDDVRRA